ncbi:TetR/AcrR family transcriptional regulator [Arthrobacter sp. B2a2-09]|uniref:TetR/AcrR family transcriptional regulator n=1 Tax=Arthrobacter sp. B2a2-09 TaxID=2952822 RepID=UPI0022CD7679|nr:TetR family transcriptional regulator [Arthrobacter sp. B2a2-09]MCZ9880606.1 TetR/AcrR family transcriptional regulator [Arthrobacter sp. B2a2-09]
MVESNVRELRSDAARNRGRVVAAARAAFAEHGHDVPLEEIAQAANVSRTTLYRNFATREELAAVVYEANVSLIENKAAELHSSESGVVALYDFVLGEQQADRGLAQMLTTANMEWLKELSSRTSAAFEPLFERGLEAGIVHRGVRLEDLMISFAMHSGALNEIRESGQMDLIPRVRGMLHRALFRTAGE